MSFCGIPFAVIIILGVLTTLGWWVFQTAVQHHLASRRMDRAENRREAFMLSRDTDRRAPRQARRSPVNGGSDDDDDDLTARPARRSTRPARRPVRWATPEEEEEGADEVAALNAADPID